MRSQQFRDTRTGEIVTQVPILEIAHFEEYSGPLITGDFACNGCERPELECSADPCEAVREDRDEKPPNHYEERQERRRERYLDLAHKNEAKSASDMKASHAATVGIPFGQPILVGHHSEKRHRNALKRSDNAMRRSIEADDKAAHYRSKAAGVGKAGISSDDPEAVQKLQAKIARSERDQELMKKCNKAIRANKTEAEQIIALVELGSTESQAHKLIEPDFCGRVGFADYVLKNNNANIRRMKQRIKTLKSAPTETTEENHENGVSIVQNVEENRVQIIFPGKPPAEVRAILKSQGFRWSRYNTAWQRHLNNGGIYAAEQALASIAKQE